MVDIPIYSIIFEDGTKYLGGTDYYTTLWNDMPDKNIKRLFYRLPSGDHLTLSGYDAYYHFIEATKDLNSKGQGKETLASVNLLLKKDNKILWYKISLTSRNGIGAVSYMVCEATEEFMKKFNPKGWRYGK